MPEAQKGPEGITSLCTTYSELLASDDFMRVVRIVLKQAVFKEDTIVGYFQKLKDGEELSEKEKANLKSFFENENVAKAVKGLLEKFQKSRIPGTDNINQGEQYLAFLREILEPSNFEEVRAKIAELAGITGGEVSETLEYSEDVQRRRKALEKYPHLKDTVTITNSGIRVQTSAGEMRFGFEQIKGEVNHADANAQYTEDQLNALVELFGRENAPYMEILGLKDTRTYDGKEYDYNFYWSSSVNQDNVNFAWGLYLDSDGVYVSNRHHTLVYSAFSPEN